MEQYSICLDVGGTSIKGAVMDNCGTPLSSIQGWDSLSNQSKEVIVGNFLHIFSALLSQHPDCQISHVNLAFPGDFNYSEGICLITGIGKYDALYGLSLRELFAAGFAVDAGLQRLVGVPITFINDVTAFAKGSCRYAAASAYTKVMHICFGTGCGSAFTLAGEPLLDKKDGVPKNGWIYNTPFLNGIIDDYLSVRGLERLSRIFLNQSLNGYHLWQLAESGDVHARSCFASFGEHIAYGLKPFLESFQPDCLVLGGRITGSFSYFSDPLSGFCQKNNIYLYTEPETSLRALQGLI